MAHLIESIRVDTERLYSKPLYLRFKRNRFTTVFQVIDRYLLQHFVFESNDCIQFNGLHGNFALNKYMSLNDWQEIYSCLQNDIAGYIQNDRIQLKPNEFILNSMNIRLNINWTELDKEFYQKIVPNISAVYPLVMHISISTISNIAEFKWTEPIVSDDVSAIYENCNEVSDVLPPIKNCSVFIPKLKSIDVAHKKSMSSTPLERHQSNIKIPIENDVSVISSQDDTRNSKSSMRKRLFAQLINDTPQNRKIRSLRRKCKIRPSQRCLEKGPTIRQIKNKAPKARRNVTVISKQNDKKTSKVKNVNSIKEILVENMNEW